MNFAPHIIYRDFFSHYPHPMLINYGDCFRWAWIAYKLFNNIKLWSNSSHAFISHNDLFYDSEHTNGIKNWRRLRTIKAIDLAESGLPIPMTSLQFQKHWSILNKVDWNLLNADTTGYLLHHS